MEKDARLNQAQSEMVCLRKKLQEVEVALGHQSYEREEAFYSAWMTAYRCVCHTYDIDWSVVDQNLNNGVGNSRLPDEVLPPSLADRYGPRSP